MKTVIIAVDNGFYFFGTEAPSSDQGYLVFKDAAMSGGFQGGKGIAGVAKGAQGATITLDRIDGDLIVPTSRVVFLIESVDLYKRGSTTVRC